MAPSIAAALNGRTLVECLKGRAQAPERVAFWLESLDAPTETVTAGALLDAAERAARRLAGLGLAPGERMMLVLPTSVDFVQLFWGAIFAAATPVPAYPPVGLSQLPSFTAGLVRMARVARARLVVVPAPLRDYLIAEAGQDFAPAQIVAPEDIWDAPARADLPAPPAPDDLALIQFSSGSTGEPRGVCLSHTNMLANVRSFLARMSVGPRDACASWLPLYHDMGLIGTLLGPLMCGGPVALLSPLDFLRRPGFWLQVISKHRATISVAPQFAFNLCVRKADPEELAGVDLSCLRVLLNGAEPIRTEGLAAFEKKFKKLGLRPNVVTPCYGLAEVTLAASMCIPGRKLRTCRPTRAAGERRDAAKSKPAGVVSVGPPMDGMEIAIRGLDGEWLAAGREGEICVRGPSVCRGCLTEQGIKTVVDGEGWLATGDLGFLDRGELCVTGRLKDLIIVGGRNYHPQELESAAAGLDGFRPGRIVAFGVSDPERATEALVVVAETDETEADRAAVAVARLRQRMLERFGVVPHDTVLVKRGAIPLTTSGKLRRSQARIEYESDALRDVVFRILAAAPHAARAKRRQSRKGGAAQAQRKAPLR